MFLSYLKIFFRNALRQKTYTLINVFGLTVGMAASILITFWVLDEISYDQYFDKAGRIYRIDLYSATPQTRTPYPMAYALARDFPEIERATSLSPIFGPNLSRPTFSVEYLDTRFDEKNIYGADTNFFDIFSFEFIMGDPNTAFYVPHCIIMTRKTSEKYFGQANPIGKMLIVNNEFEFMVTGVLEDLPPNIHFHFDFLISYAFLKQISSPSWFTWADAGHYNYVLTAPGADIAGLQEKIPEWILQYLDYGEEINQDILDGNIRFQFTPVRHIHLRSDIRWELEPNGNITYVYIFLSTALLILIVACVNYMNLATARFSRRAREVAIRKTAGASRSILIMQFLTESIIQTFIAAIFAGLIVELLLDPFGTFTGKDYTYYYSRTGIFLAAMILLTVVVGLVAGSYPAFYLSSFSPMRILKGKLSSRASASRVRIVLVVFQFAASIFLIVGTITIFRQVRFLENTDLGFSEEDLVQIPLKDERLRLQAGQIEESLLQYPGVLSAAAASNVPGGRINNNPLRHEESSRSIEASEVSIDYEYIQTLGLEIVEGRNFSREFGMDSVNRFILNESAVRALEISSPVNQIIAWDDDDGLIRGEIIGIVKDFHYRSLHENIAPLIMMIKPAEYSYLLLRLSHEDIRQTLKDVEKEWKKYDDRFTFEYAFLDDEFDKQYNNEDIMGTIYWMMAVLAVIIAGLGLFGLSTFTVEQKNMEIGIRKVHGATAAGILVKLLVEFSKWVLLAFLIAAPLAYLGMSYWLRNFSYQANLPIWIFLTAVLLTEIIAILAVIFQSIRASMLKPVDSLRYE